MNVQTNSDVFGSTPILLLVVILVGGAIAILSTWALLRQTVTVDNTGNVTEIKVPFFGKLKTTYPAVGTAFLGVALVAFAATRIPGADSMPAMVPLDLEVTLADGDDFTMLFLGAIPSRQWVPVTSLPEDKIISFDVPVGERYFGVAVLVRPGEQRSTPEMLFEQYQAQLSDKGYYAKADFSNQGGTDQ